MSINLIFDASGCASVACHGVATGRLGIAVPPSSARSPRRVGVTTSRSKPASKYASKQTSERMERGSKQASDLIFPIVKEEEKETVNLGSDCSRSELIRTFRTYFRTFRALSVSTLHHCR